MKVGDGEIGITTPFGGVVPASNAGPRANGRGAGASNLPRVNDSSRAVSSSILPAPCRLCGGPSWLQDDSGAIHPCCKLSWTEATGCLSCRTSEHLNRQHRQRKLTRDKYAAMITPTEADSLPGMETENG